MDRAYAFSFSRKFASGTRVHAFEKPVRAPDPKCFNSLKALPKYSAGASLIWILVLLVFISGLVLVGFSAQQMNLTKLENDEEIGEQLNSMKPPLNPEQSDSVRQVIKSSETKEMKESTINILMRDVGIALLSSAILVLVIEWYARSNMDREIRLGVIEATFKRLMPSAIFDEIKTYVISAQTVKNGWKIKMKISKDAKISDENPSLYLSETRLQYDLKNVTSSRISCPISAELDAEPQFLEAGNRLYPRFISLSVGEEYFDEARLRESGIVEETGLKLMKDLKLGPKASTRVVVVIKELIASPDTTVWTTSHPTDGASMEIDSDGAPDLQTEVHVLHPDGERLKKERGRNEWTFEGGLLPWQGFRMVTRSTRSVTDAQKPVG